VELGVVWEKPPTKASMIKKNIFNKLPSNVVMKGVLNHPCKLLGWIFPCYFFVCNVMLHFCFAYEIYVTIIDQIGSQMETQMVDWGKIRWSVMVAKGGRSKNATSKRSCFRFMQTSCLHWSPFFRMEFDDRMMEYKKGPMVARDGHPY